jgi:hypothetical protein
MKSWSQSLTVPVACGTLVIILWIMIYNESPAPNLDTLTARVQRLEERVEALQHIHDLIGKR